VDLGDLGTGEDWIWVDGRTEEAYQTAHYPGAFFISLDDWEESSFALLETWEPGQRVVVYCDDIGCGVSQDIALQLREELGSEEVYWLEDGWEGMQKAGWVE
jgi:rhodanese-related sulfurtransferase